jgi:hypothetical protein
VIPDRTHVSDPLGLVGSAVDDGVRVFVGNLEVTNAIAIETLKVRHAVGEIAAAEFALDSGAPMLAEADFTADVVIGVGVAGGLQRLFTGSVVSAIPRGEQLEVSCSAFPALNDPTTGVFVSQAHPLDTMYALLRDAGLPDERMAIQGLDQLPLEIMEVIVPIDGLALAGAARVADVAFVPRDDASRAVRGLGDHAIVEEFRARSAFAVTYVSERLLMKAEASGLRRIDASLAWANVNLRYSNGARPDGSLNEWNRSQMRQLGSRSDLVAVRGITTGRVWLRHRRARPMGDLAFRPAADSVTSAAIALQDAAGGLRAAVVAAARASSSTDPLTRITAVSECLEFYAGATKLPPLFTKADLKRLRKVAAEFPAEKRSRIEHLLNSAVNNAPLMARVRYRLAQDAIPVTEHDMELLARVRAQRNDLVHGRVDEADDRELEQATALLARIIAYAAKAEAARRVISG